MRPAFDNLDAFFDPKMGAAAAQLLRGGAVVLERVMGWHDPETENMDGGAFRGRSSGSEFTCKQSDAALMKPRDVLVIDGERFEIVRPPVQDGGGLASVSLAPEVTQIAPV